MFLNRELYGFGAAPKTVDAKTLARFLDKNEQVLKQTGLTDDYLATHQALSGSEAEIAEAKAASSARRFGAASAKEAAGAAEKQLGQTQSLREKAVARLSEAQKPPSAAEARAGDKEAKERAAKALAKLTEQQQGAKAKASELQSAKTASEKEAQAAKTLSENYAKQWSALTDANTTPRKAAEALKSLTKDLRERGHLTAEQERDFDAQARDIIAKYEDQAKARGLLKALAIAAATAGAAYAGVRGSEAISGVNVFFPHGNRH